MWKLVSVCLEIALILMEDRCTVCVEHTWAGKSFWTHPKELLGDVGHVENHFFLMETVLVSVQDSFTVCIKHVIGLEIVLDAPDGTPR